MRLARLERVGGPRLFAKCEFLGPGNSIFDRSAVAALDAGWRGGHLEAGRALVTAGGTDASISIAMAASASGHPLTVVIPRSLGPERRRILMDYGATLEALDDDAGLEGAQEHAFAIAGRNHGLFLDLFRGPEIVAAYERIGEELIEALGSAPTLTVAGLDLGAIPTGIARGLADAEVLAVEPATARIGSGGPFGPHLLSGLAPAPGAVALDRTRITDFESVDDRTAWEMTEKLTLETGILAGIASGAVLAVALRRAASLDSSASVVAVLPDSGERRFALAAFFS